MARQRGTNEESATIQQPLLPNDAWADYMRGWTDQVPANALNVYGTHRDYRWKYVPPDATHPEGSWRRLAAGKRAMPVHGPVNWDSLWPNWQSVGDDFLETGTATDPLSPEQRTALNEEMKKSNYIINSFSNRLGGGEYGSVWRVVCHERTTDGLPDIPGRDFWAACKVIRLNQQWRDQGLDFGYCVNLMLKDMHALRYIKHKNLVKYYDCIPIPDTQSGFPYSTVLLLMEFCDGDLDQVIKLWGVPLPLDFCRKWMRDIALGVQYLHTNRNMTHLDIKPENIMFQFSASDTYRPKTVLANITSQWETMTFKLGDLGSCQSFTKEAALTTECGGTPLWCAPEMEDLKGMVKVPTAAKPCDVFSLAATLVSCLIAETDQEDHYFDNTLFDHMNEIMYGQVEVPGITSGVAYLIASMIHPEPKQRPTIDQVLQNDFLKPFPTRDEKRKRDFISLRDVEEKQRPRKMSGSSKRRIVGTGK